ncbi:hypothetical protein J6590_015693 [Homalodisca vitripennis]|nr:hypothetical protein J6590_015693 [Homalodisca vitripennis]
MPASTHDLCRFYYYSKFNDACQYNDLCRFHYYSKFNDACQYTTCVDFIIASSMMLSTTTCVDFIITASSMMPASTHDLTQDLCRFHYYSKFNDACQYNDLCRFHYSASSMMPASTHDLCDFIMSHDMNVGEIQW